MNNGERRKPSKISLVLGFLVFFIAFCVFMALAYIIVKYAGLSEFATVMLSGIGGLILFFVFAVLINFIRMQRFKHINRFTHNILLDAFEQVSHGNFNIFVESNPNDPHSEIADAFNEMVKNLGSLETMRQDFISNVSHEIQSPLTSIKGFAALLKNDDLLPEERRRYAEIIEAESQRLSSLSDNLLKLSVLDSEKKPLKIREYRLDLQLQSVALMLEPQWSAKNITLEADLEKTTINGDEELLLQVWVNLLHNAIKFTPDGGSIKIAAGNEKVTISDTGCGIKKEDLPHIFERFYKADKARDRSLGGNGLGLALVKKIIDLHGFSIDVESEENKGTRFTIRLS
ncbi:HAMP domain-containing sensor histidine kinase [Thermoanaerobacterium sp. CMT5567-10]|uniref:sensor histidine kinase n=1 Tax=Thermoanaerobacterium sp. CMT5567-10 TaxID=3061989 RepID=UPI0026DF163A|nr:HAMP domain-containing sensor histidine kinase [Thermoanaerobacterium sp. CMT5567-10]WKV08433.1 HAMP domain-containing sensor histidine kinase [Thermoanaerobacterium sp. CMT5567-10]